MTILCIIKRARGNINIMVKVTKLMQKRYLFLLATVIVLISIGSALAAPRMVIPEKTFDFGIVPQQSSISHVFWLHSAGDDTLKILKIVPG